MLGKCLVFQAYWEIRMNDLALLLIEMLENAYRYKHIACLGIRFDDLPGRYFEVVFILAALNHPLKGSAGTMVFRWLQQDLLRAWQTLCRNIP